MREREDANRSREVGSADEIRARASVACNERVLVMKSEVMRRPAVGSSDLLDVTVEITLTTLTQACHTEKPMPYQHQWPTEKR